MANENNRGYSPLTEEEQEAIRGMSIEDLLDSVKTTLDAPAGASADVTTKKPAETPLGDEPRAFAAAPAEDWSAPRTAPAKTERKPSAPGHGRKTDAPVSANTKPKKKKKFGLALLIYALALLLVIGAGMFLLWKYVDAYERSRPEHVVDAFMASVDETYWETLAESSSAMFPTTEFENSNDIARQCFEAVRGQLYTYRKRAADSTDEAPAYTIRVGGNDFAKLTLRRFGSAGFGFDTWTPDTVELLPDFVPEARTVTITVPTGSQITLNGVTVPDRMITETSVCAELSELEKNFTTTVPTMSVYTVEGLYGNLDVKVIDSAGRELAPVYADGTLYTYELHVEETHSVTVVAPNTAEVKVNGAVLTEDYITDMEPLQLLSRVTEYLPGGTLPQMCTYTVTGIVSEIESVTAKDADGKTLAGLQGEDGSWSFAWGGGTIPSSRMERVRGFMEAYLDFSADVYDATDTNWANIQTYLVTDGDAYQRFEFALDGLDWTQSSEAVLNSCSVLSYAEFGENCFVVRVAMNSTVTRANGDTTEDNTFDVVFVQSDGEWLVETMESI